MNTLDEQKLSEASDKITFDMLINMEHGEEIELNDKFTLYHYTEDDIIVVCESESWEEIYQMMYHPDTKEIFFESLI